MSNYSPFPGKQIFQISTEDLDILSTVSEGWYVEYKRDLPSQSSIAKSISAFANTYGGWLFFGVEESAKSDNVAASCPGIARAELDSGLQKIRQSAAQYLNPTPHFEIKVVWGPNSTMNLTEDRAVICVEVNLSPLAPHIHSSGCIYRRVSDSSEPKAENDRHQLDLLWDRRVKIDEEYKSWIEREPERSKDEGEWPYLRLLLDADLCGAKDKSWDLTLDQINEVLNDSTSGPALPFETIQPSGHGWVARQTSSLDRHERFGLTWIVGRGLQCELWLPLNTFEANEPDHLIVNLGKYAYFDRFLAEMKRAKAGFSRIVDLNQLLMVLIAVTNTYLKLLAKAKHPTSKFHAKAILGEVWRTIPFLDSEVMLERISKYGLPLCLTSEAMVPGGRDAKSFFEVTLLGDEEAKEIQFHTGAFWLFELVCRALGLQGMFADDSNEELSKLFTELLDSFDRTRDNSINQK